MATVVPDVVRYAQEFKNELRSGNLNTSLSMATHWAKSAKELDIIVNKITEEIEVMRAMGKEVTENWVRELDYYKQLRRQTIAQYNSYGEFTEKLIDEESMKFMKYGTNEAQALIMASSKPLNPLYIPKLPDREIEILYSSIRSTVTPLGKLLMGLGVDTWKAVDVALLLGMAQGVSTQEIARRMTQAGQLGLNRAMTIARTEINRAYRIATQETYDQSGVVHKYKRMANKGSACMACLLLDGQVYESAMSFEDHPNGACAMIPCVDGMPEPKWETGQEYFEKLDPEEQMRRMGKNYYDSWKAKEFKLSDMAYIKPNYAWGGMPATRSLSTLAPDWRSKYATATSKVVKSIETNYIAHEGMSINEIVSLKDTLSPKIDAMKAQMKANPIMKAVGDWHGDSGLPTMISESELDELVKKKKAINVYRGVTDSPSHGKTAANIIEEFKTDKDMYYGYGVYGNGTYTSPEYSTAYMYGGNRDENVFRLGIRKDAKIVEYDDLLREGNLFTQELENLFKNNLIDAETYVFSKKLVEREIGAFAMLRGYDAIYCTGAGHYNILNRTVLYVLKNG